MNDITKTPRVYVDQAIALNGIMTLPEGPAHYLKNVLRRQPGDRVRIFNAGSGEFAARIDQLDKKSAILVAENQLRPALENIPRRLHIITPVLKKDRMDFLTEKAVELGVHVIHPIICDHSDVRDLNTARVTAQMVEAAEQCERLDIPSLSPLRPLRDVLATWDKNIPILAALERTDAPPLAQTVPKNKTDIAILVGPAGGWSASELTLFKQSAAPLVPVSLGDIILRSETATLALLAYLNFQGEK